MLSWTSFRSGILIGLIVLVLALVFGRFDAIPQDPAYHRFADSRRLFGIPNFLDVISNLGFVVVGAWGGWRVSFGALREIPIDVRRILAVLFWGITLVGLGSGYYHLWPDNHTLLWDRLPMAVVFMALFSLVVSEYLSAALARRLFIPLILLGIASVIYWYLTELGEAGDLRFYALVQYLPALLIPVILLCYSSSGTPPGAYWGLLLVYAVAKVLEHFDGPVFQLLGFVSGHSLKHLVAAAGLCWLLLAVEKSYREHSSHA